MVTRKPSPSPSPSPRRTPTPQTRASANPLGDIEDQTDSGDPPPVGGQTQQQLPTFLGFPPGSVVGRESYPQSLQEILAGYQTTFTPGYTQVDIFTPGTWGVEKRARLQANLVRAGLLDRDYQRGVWDAASRSAYAALLADANVAGITGEQMLGQYQASTTRFGGRDGDEPKRAPLTIRTMNPADLDAALEQVYEERTGRKPTEEERQKFRRSYHGVESEYQRNLYNTVEGGGTVQEAPTPAAFANQQVEQNAGLDVAGHDFGNVFDNFLQIIGANE